MVQTEPAAESRTEAQSPPADEKSRESSDRANTECAERPQLAPNMVLAGEMQDGAYEQQQWLVQRDGQFVQLTELLYRVAENVDGKRDLAQIAEAVSRATNRAVSADNVRQLLSSKLIPLGLVARADGTVAEQKTPDGGAAARSPLQINMRVRALSPRFINPVTAILQNLFWLPMLFAMLVVAAAAQFYVFVIHGVASSVHDVLYHPALMFVVLGMIIVGTIWHEFGHAAALRYGGGEVRGMGAGIYLVYPAFYTDVTDNYRLPRWSKVRTDLGGFYFNLIFCTGLVGLYFLTHLSWLLLIVLLIDAEIIQQTLPFGRYDGYWTLADITGIPDFFSRIPGFIKSVLPFVKSGDSEFSQYKRWVKVVFGLYVIVTVPIMAFLFFMTLKAAPRVLATGWDSGHKQLDGFSTAHLHGDTLTMVLAIAQLLILALPTLGMLYVFFNLVRRGGAALWKYSKPSPARRVKGALIATGVVAFLSYLWVPQLPFGKGQAGALAAPSTWHPIAASERGTLGDAGRSLALVPIPYNPFRRFISTPASPPAQSGQSAPLAQPATKAHATATVRATVRPTPGRTPTPGAPATAQPALLVTPTVPAVTTPIAPAPTSPAAVVPAPAAPTAVQTFVPTVVATVKP